MPYVLLEWRLASSRSQSVLPSVDALHSHFTAHNTALLQRAAASNQPPPLPLPPPTFPWANLLSSDVLPLLALPDTNLPPLPGIQLPTRSSGGAGSVLARHCLTHTTQGVHAVMDVVLLPIELLLLEDEEQGEDRLYLNETTVKAATEAVGGSDGDSGESGAAGEADYQFGLEWELYEQSSKVRAVRAAERLCDDFVMTRLGCSQRSVFVNDSEIGRDTARFMQTFTPLEFNTQTVSQYTHTPALIPLLTSANLRFEPYSTLYTCSLSVCCVSFL